MCGIAGLIWQVGAGDQLERLDLLRDHGALPDEVCARADRALAAGDPRWRRVWQWVVLGHWLRAHVR